MKRSDFLKRLGIGSVAVIATPQILEALSENETTEAPLIYDEKINKTSEWNKTENHFSDYDYASQYIHDEVGQYQRWDIVSAENYEKWNDKIEVEWIINGKHYKK